MRGGRTSEQDPFQNGTPAAQKDEASSVSMVDPDGDDEADEFVL
jgi:hypothetical protein